MGFVYLILFWPILLAASALYLLGMALPFIIAGLLVWNVIVLSALLVIRYVWKKHGTMDRAYIDTLDGWKRIVLLLLRWGLMLLIVWEILLVIGCAAGFIWLPGWLAMLL